MMELNESQKKAVMHTDGPLLVAAGPGSGKTRVITERIYELIKAGVKPAEILVITFTRAAAIEMRERFRKNHPDISGVFFGTFHSVFFMILKAAYNFNAENILRESVGFSIMRSIVSGLGTDIRDENEFSRDMLSEISRVKGSSVNIDDYYSTGCPADTFREIYRKYNSELRKRHLIDFDDMLIYTYELLDQRKDIRKNWQRQFRYILIDEFQDINPLQYTVVKLLSGENKNVFAVGDDDQSIYGFRGSRPDIMKRFIKEFGAEKIILGINYRSTPEIVSASGKLISHNKNHIPKKLTAARVSGDPVDIREFQDIRGENERIRLMIGKYNESGIKYSEMTVLYRTNIQARLLASRLGSCGIPFFMKDIIPNIYQHWTALDILSYIKIAMGDSSRGLYVRIINRPKRYISRDLLSRSQVDLEELMDFFSGKEWMQERIEQLEYDLDTLSKMKPFAAVNFIRSGIGYDDYIKEYADYRHMNPDELFGILDELGQDARNWNSYEEWFRHIDEYTRELEEQKKNRQRPEADENAVVLQTMHSSKGLEYKVVFIPDACEGVTPHTRAVLNEAMEEERRLFYVAMTRAEDHLHIFYTRERNHKDAEMSRFVNEILRQEI